MNRPDDVRTRLVWQTRPIHDEPPPEDWALLTEEDLARAAAIAHPSAMARFVVARALLRGLLATFRPDLDPATLRIESEASGRPYVAGQSHLHVSLSHTDGLAAAAVAATGPVGIDVEHLSRDDLPPARLWLAPAELPELSRLDPELKRLVLLHRWVAKEAAIKAHPCPQLAERRRITLLCQQQPSNSPTVVARTGVRSGPLEAAHARARPPAPVAESGHRPLEADRSQVTAEQGATPKPSPAPGAASAEQEQPSASPPRTVHRDAPSSASWCGTGRARLELGPGRARMAASAATSAPSASSASSGANDESLAGGQAAPDVRWLTVDWYALADRFLIAIARPPDDPASRP